ncbi:hypothetical protein [Oceanidesulfovibrio marinus]|nr:hypothetical protein [Oceanidesulfovibrio marinus]
MTKFAGGARILADGNEYDMGVLEPTATPAGTSSGGTGAEQTRVYTFTCVNGLGEEGPPSPPSAEITSNEVGATVELTGIATPDESGTDHPPITAKRIYRAAVGESGNVEYMYVDEIPAAQTTYTDTKNDDELGETLPSIGWRKPPSDLMGLTSLPGGILAGFSARQVRLSEPYFYHAWPDAYSHEIDYDIVSVAASGRTLYVFTTGPVYQMVVNDPVSAVPERLSGMTPCSFGDAVWETTYGVVFASTDGLYLISPGLSAPVRITAPLYNEDSWREYKPASFFGTWHGSHLYIAYEKHAGEQGILIVTNIGSESPLLTKSDMVIDAIASNADDGNLYVAVDSTIYLWEGNALLSMTGRWRSKEYVSPEPANFSAALIDADYIVAAQLQEVFSLVVTANEGRVGGALGDSEVGEYPFANDAFGVLVLQYLPGSFSEVGVILRLYGDGELKYETRVVTNRPFVLPDGYQARRWFVEVQTTTTVKRVVVAESAGEIYV